MKIYLDLCCFNRPYDDQTQARIRLETEAKILIQAKIKDGGCRLIWSAVLDFECSKNPYEEHQVAILHWRTLAHAIVMADAAIVARAREIANHGVGHYDALHLASAVAGGAELFVTTDDKLLKKARLLDVLPIMLPGEALAAMENWYED